MGNFRLKVPTFASIVICRLELGNKVVKETSAGKQECAINFDKKTLKKHLLLILTELSPVFFIFHLFYKFCAQGTGIKL